MKTIEINSLKLRVEDGLEVVIEGELITIRAQHAVSNAPAHWEVHHVYPPQPTTMSPSWPSSIPQITCVA